MAATTRKSAKTGIGRDAYDDFLDGKDTSTAKKGAGSSAAGTKKPSQAKPGAKKSGTGTKKTADTGKRVSAGKTSAAGTKKASDSAGKKTSASNVKKTSSAAKKSASSAKTARKVTDVEEGIVSLGARQKPASGNTTRKSAGKASGAKKTENAASSKKAGKKSRTEKTASARKKTGSNAAVLALDNPVAFMDPWEEPARRPASRGKAASGTKTAARASAKTGGVRKANASPKRSGDMFLENPPARKNTSARKKPAGKKKRAKPAVKLGGWDIFFSAGIVCVLALMLWQGAQYSNFLMMKSAVDRQTFYEGTTVEGVDVSGMTLEAALDYWQGTVEPHYAGRTVTLDNGVSVTAEQLGYASDYVMVLSNAWNAGRSGSLEERYHAISSRQETPVAYTVSRTPYNIQAVESFVMSVAEQVNTPVQEAGIESFDLKTFKFVFTDPVPGKRLDAQALKDSVISAFDAGGGNVQMVIEEVKPTGSVENIASRYGMIASAITNASSSSKNRLTNIKLSLSAINGTRLKPGETFSFNKVVGERTASRGYKTATAYSSGEVTEQVGGGICQVSTTLFNAAVKADLKIVERHNHSLTVGYVDKGKDAAVNWGSQDLRFTNDTGDDIYICCYLTDDKRVRFGIFGKLLPNGETVTLEGVTTGTIDYDTEYQESGLLGPGEEVVLQSGKKGYTAEAYKIRWDAKGNQISRELLCKSKYKSVKEIIQVGPPF